MKGYEDIEVLLYEFPELCSELRLRLLEQREGERGAPVTTSDYSQPYSDTNRFHSAVEEHLCRLEEMDAELNEMFGKYTRIRVALDCLTERQQKIVELRYWRKLGFVEIAVRLDISETTVYDDRKKALRKLKKVGMANVVDKEGANSTKKSQFGAPPESCRSHWS